MLGPVATLVIITRAGETVAQFPIEPAGPNLAPSGMQFVESLQWLSPTRIAVGGSVNPSQSQYYVVDLSKKAEVADFVDDESAPAFSPDGNHVAILTGAPHFSPAATQTPRLTLDGNPIDPEPPVQGFINEPNVWCAACPFTALPHKNPATN